MRKQVRETVECVHNEVWECEILEIKKKSIVLRAARLVVAKNIPQSFQLAFGNLKPSRLEMLLEKCTEIGVTDFYPLITSRTQYNHISHDRSIKIIKSAASQSLKTYLPNLNPIQSLHKLKLDDTWAMASLNTEPSERSSGFTRLLVGPEGGWSQAEEDYCKECGVSLISLGHCVLRAETACIIGSWKLLSAQ
jgi:16S rRNA (uracil1498-N3)-methyltransferase